MKARCIVHIPVNRVELRETTIRDPGPGEILTQALYSTISPGTELRVLRTDPLDQPYVPGYTHVARVLKSGPNTNLPEGTLICTSGTRDAGGITTHWGAHISHAIIPAAAATIIPPNVDALEACLIRLAAISYRGLHYSQPLANERVAVLGLGVIGQLSARLHALAGCHVIAADRSPTRVAQSAAAGITSLVTADTLKATFSPHFPLGADIVVDATGAPSVLLEGPQIAVEHPWGATEAREPRYIIQGAFEANVTIPFRTAFLKALSFYIPRDSVPFDVQAVVQLLAQRKLAVRDLISDVRPPEAAAQTYAELRDPATNLLTVAFRWH